MHPREAELGHGVVSAAREAGVHHFVQFSVTHPQLEPLLNHQARASRNPGAVHRRNADRGQSTQSRLLGGTSGPVQESQEFNDDDGLVPTAHEGPSALSVHIDPWHLEPMSTQMMEMAIDEDQARLRLRHSLLEYLERNMEHHDAVVGAVESSTIHSRDTMMRLASLLVQRDAALVTHLDLLAETGWPYTGTLH